MKNISVRIDGYPMDFFLARQIGELIACQGSDQVTLVSWCDMLRQNHSPQCLHCEINGKQGWEVYGRNHGGRLRISFNEDALVLIYS
jgi:hypothetical protein